MKKLLKISALIAAMALSCAFFGCSNGNSSGGSTTISFDDCTATASNGSYTFNSGSGTMAVDLSKEMTPEKLTEFNALSTDEKKQTIIKRMECPEDATITFNENIVTIKASFSTEYLQQIQSTFDLSTLPPEAIIKTNSDKTKYTITLSREGSTMVFYISKD